MDKGKIEWHLKEYLSGKPDKEGEKLFEEWYYGQQTKNWLNKFFNKKERHDLEYKMFQSINERIVEKEGIMPINRKPLPYSLSNYHIEWVFRLAATISILLISSVFYFTMITGGIASPAFQFSPSGPEWIKESKGRESSVEIQFYQKPGPSKQPGAIHGYY